MQQKHNPPEMHVQYVELVVFHSVQNAFDVLYGVKMSCHIHHATTPLELREE
jgi:hypothetical protein